MARLSIFVLVAFLSTFFLIPDVSAKDTSAPIAKKKKAASNVAPSKRKAVRKQRASTKQLVAKPRTKAAARLSRKSAQNSTAIRRKQSQTSASAKRVHAARAKHTAKKSIVYSLKHLESRPELLRSNVAYVVDQSNAKVLYAKNEDTSLPIASITKLMTALIVLEAKQDMDEMLEVTKEDVDTIKFTSSRLPVGSMLTRENMLHIALMSSENRAASALGRNYPGGLPAFVKTMNAKAKELGMTDTRYVEPTGLSRHNVSSARDLIKLVMAAHNYSLIRTYSTNTDYKVDIGGPSLQYRNTNRLISNPEWEIGLQKTGYIAEAGRCLVMQALIQGRSIIMVFLGAPGRLSRTTDARSMRRWLEEHKLPTVARTEPTVQG